jgi:hypothetical protein
MIILKCFYKFLYILLFQFLILNSIQAQADFFASQTEGCTQFKVKFTPDFSAVRTDTIQSVKWYFGFGDTISSSKPDFKPDTVTFKYEGQYTIVMVINNRKKSAIVKTNYITVHRTVQSVFKSDEHDANFNYTFIPFDIITDTGATYNYIWTFKNIFRDTKVDTLKVNYQNPSAGISTHLFDTGIYHISLRIEDSYGCVSQYEKIYTFINQVNIPNVFVPPIHHFFQIDPLDWNTVLLFKVFNRNGLLVFEQEAPIISWNGQTNSGKDLNTGVYYYILEAVEGDPLKRYSQKGFIHLYR